jgi:deazaflavin-dependent oxidoreductase (nitroreductase family)
MGVVRRILVRYVLRVPVYLYRWGFVTCWGGGFCFWSTSADGGRRTGKRHETVLEVMEYRDDSAEAVVMSAFGRSASWLRNVEANLRAEVVIGSRRFIAQHRILEEDEAVTVVRSYEERNRLIGPIVRLVLSRFAGWRYRSSDSDRRRLVRQLPLIAFRPKTSPLV